MFRNFLVLLTLILFTNCTGPGTALLGPAFTGATTKSLAQASLSFGTNQIVRTIHKTSVKSKKKVQKIVKKFENFEIQSNLNLFPNFHK